jgi:hypothetical protein
MNYKHRLPFWFYVGLVTNLTGWIISWADLVPIRHYMFIFIWGGFVLVLDGINYRLRGNSLISRSFSSFIFIALVSSLFWWYFELVNLVTRNWYYIIETDLTPLVYQLSASLYFSTVIPAVFEIAELIQFRKLVGKTVNWIKTPASSWKLILLIGLTSSILPLIRPDIFFPLIWLAPAFLLDPLNYKLGFDSLLRDLRQGNWSRLVTLALAAFFTGILWELWNLYADPKWIYAIPYVDFSKIFEMPVLGYLGYLPFGWVIFDFYAFIQGIFRYPKRQFFTFSEDTFRPRVRSGLLITTSFVFVLGISMVLANMDERMNYYFNRLESFPIQSPYAEFVSLDEEYSGHIGTCHYSFVAGKCLYSGIGQTYLLIDNDGKVINPPNLKNVKVIGSLEPKLIGLDEIKVNWIVGY